MTWPVASRLSSHVPLWNDTWIFVWDIDHVRRALTTPGARVFETDRVFHPEGISLAFHTLAPLYGALAVPLAPSLTPVVLHNLFFLLCFSGSGLAAWWLAWRLTGSPGGAFLAGALYAFSPYHFAHAYHLNLLTLQFLPLTAWAVLRLLETASRRHAIALAASAAASFYACLEYAFFSFLLAAVALAYGLATRGRGSVRLARSPADLALRSALAAALAALLALPGLVPLAAEAVIERHYDDPVEVDFSADLLSWVTPSVQHALWGGYTMKVYQHFPGVLAEWTTFVGVTVAALGLLALRARRRRPVGLWVTVAATFGLLAMGPTLRVLGQPLPVPLPYRLLETVPVVSAIREPSRFAAVVTLATSVLAAFGFAELRASRAGRRAWAALPLALLEFTVAPLPTSPARVPAFYSTLAADPGDYAVLDVPGDLALREHLYHQAVHGKRIFAGYVARIPAASRRWLETCPLLADPAGWEVASARLGEAAPGERYVRLARALDVRYALVHADFYRRRRTPERFERALANLLALPGARLAAREDDFAAVRIDGR